MEGRYNSTYGFVSLNSLEKEAEDCFGKGWEAEDDVNQIKSLLNSLGKTNFIVSLIPDLEEDDILVTEDVCRKITYDDTRDVSIRILDVLFKNKIIKESEDHYPFELQDEIHDKINELLGLDIDDNFEVKIYDNKLEEEPMEFISSHGTVLVNTDGTIHKESCTEDWLSEIQKVDIEELRRYYTLIGFEGQLDGGDVLDFGFWDEEGKYHKPDLKWREQPFNGRLDSDKLEVVLGKCSKWILENRY